MLGLWDGASHREQRYAATSLAGHRHYRGWQDRGTLELYRHLVLTGAWWDHVDDIASHLVGPILSADHAPVAPLIRQWASADDLWLRRTAILSQLGARADPDWVRDFLERHGTRLSPLSRREAAKHRGLNRPGTTGGARGSTRQGGSAAVAFPAPHSDGDSRR